MEQTLDLNSLLVTSNKSLNLYVPQFPHLQNGEPPWMDRTEGNAGCFQLSRCLHCSPGKFLHDVISSGKTDKRAFETCERPYCQHKRDMFHKGEIRLKEIGPVSWVHHSNLYVIRYSGYWLYKVMLYVSKKSWIKTWAPNLKESRNQNGDIFPHCAMAFAPGKGTPGWVNWLTLTEWCHPVSSALRPAPGRKS